MPGKYDKALILILVSSLIIKAIYLFYAYPNAALVEMLSIDASYHYRWAVAIANGDFFINAPYFRAPLYPFILAILLKISNLSLIFARAFQLLLGAFSLIVIYRIGQQTGGRKIAAISAILFLCYPMTTYFEAELLLDPIFTLFSLITLYYFLKEKENTGKYIFAGIFFGLALLTRPTILIFIPIIIYFFVKAGKSSDYPGQIIRRALMFFAITCLFFIPVTMVNYHASGRIIILPYQGGVNFYIGNNSDASGFASILPPIGEDWSQADAKYLAESESGKELSYTELSNFYWKKGASFIIDSPGDFAKLMAKKTYLVFMGDEISNNHPIKTAALQNSLLSYLPVRYPILIALSFLALFRASNLRRFVYLFWGIIFLYGYSVALFFVNSRFRLPFIPLLCILAAHGIYYLWDNVTHKRFKISLLLPVITAVLIYALASIQFFPASESDPQHALFMRGNQALRNGDYFSALIRYDSLISQNPGYKNVNVNKGTSFLKMGQSNNALSAFYSELAYNPKSAEALNNISVIYQLRNQNDSSLIYAERALREKPYYLEAAINYLRGAAKANDSLIINDSEIFRQWYRGYVDHHPAYLFEEGVYFTALGRFPEAINNHLLVVDKLKKDNTFISFNQFEQDNSTANKELMTQANYQLGYLYGLGGQYESSIIFSSKAIELNPELRPAYVNLISAYRFSGKKHQVDSMTRIYLSKWPENNPNEPR